MELSQQQYSKMTKKASPSSNIMKNCISAFLVGGFICVLGQVFTDIFFSLINDLKIAKAFATVALIFLAGLFTALGVFDKIADKAGTGTLVPITGFANAIVSSAIEFKSEGFVLGVGAKMFTIAGPVIVYGTVASVIYGIIYWITTLF